MGDGKRLQLPPYEPVGVTQGIAHIGPGAFHRSHQAVYADDLLAGGHWDWGICAIGLLPRDRFLPEVLARQHHRYIVATKHADGSVQGRVIASVGQCVYGPSDPHATFERLADPRIRIVTLTITEGGYSPAAAMPGDSFSYIVESLRRRRERGIAPFAVLSCDNIESNGVVARDAVVRTAERIAPDLAAWVRAEVPFPSSMVDRITPATTDADRALVRELWALDDEVPVVAEPFRQWVVEDVFPAGRPAFEDVGVQVVPDVRPYELMKLRMLNGGHQALAYAGLLLGHTFVHEAAADPAVLTLLRRYLGEAATALDPVPGVDVVSYQGVLQDRFANAHIRDTLARVAAYASDRLPRFVLPVVERRRAAGREASACAAVVACWARYLGGRDEQGASYDVVDSLRGELQPGLGLLDHRVLQPVGADPEFRAAVQRWLERFERVGVRAALLSR